MKRPVPRNHKSFGGFSLLELIGVLAVMAVMASVMVPVLVEQVRLAASQRETHDLEELAEGLKDHIRRTREIPDETGWSSAIAEALGRREDDVLTNVQRNERVYLIDPALRIGPPDGRLPYIQGIEGSIEPVSPRVMILSSLDVSGDLPVESGVADSATFEAIWNTPEGEVPEGWPEVSPRAGEDLKILRINLGPLFVRLILNHFDSTGSCRYSIDESGPQAVPVGGVHAFFIEGTPLGLFDREPLPETRERLSRSATYVCERGGWHSGGFQGVEPMGNRIHLGNTVLLQAGTNPGAISSVTPSDLAGALYDFAAAFVEWEGSGFPGSGSPAWSSVEAAQISLRDMSGELILIEPDPGPGPPP